MRITETHVDLVYSWGNANSNFNLGLDIKALIPPAAPLRYVNIKPVFDTGEGYGLTSLCSYVLERHGTNSDSGFLKTEIRGSDV